MTNLDNGNINDLTFPSSEESGEVLLSSAYFAPIQWYQKLNRYSSCLIEQHDNFIKQTYRNRCVIASANGPQALSIPVEKYEGVKCPMKDVRISDHDNWRHQHWNALQSSYGESPFFEYYEDDIRPLTPTLFLVATIKSTNRNLASYLILVSSTCFLTRVMRVYYTYKGRQHGVY